MSIVNAIPIPLEFRELRINRFYYSMYGSRAENKSYYNRQS